MEDVYKKYTKYEVARILGARALQISMNAPLLLNISKEKLEEMDFNPLKIAELEFEADILPITVKRPLPQKTEMEEEEEEAGDSFLTISVSSSKKGEFVHAMQKGKDVTMSIEDINSIIDNAVKEFKKIESAFEKAVK